LNQQGHGDGPVPSRAEVCVTIQQPETEATTA